MTSAPYFAPALPPRPAAPSPPSAGVARNGWMEALVALSVLAASVPFAAATGFWALITYAGCLIACSGAVPNKPGGLALVALTALILAAGPVVVAAVYRSRGWLMTGAGTFCLALFVLVHVLLRG